MRTARLNEMLLQKDMLRAHQYSTGWAVGARRPREGPGARRGARPSPAQLPQGALVPSFHNSKKWSGVSKVTYSQARSDNRLVCFCLEDLLERETCLGTRGRRKAGVSEAPLPRWTPSVMKPGGTQSSHAVSLAAPRAPGPHERPGETQAE